MTNTTVISSVLASSSVGHIVVAATQPLDSIRQAVDILGVLSHKAAFAQAEDLSHVITFYVQHGFSEEAAVKRAHRLHNKLGKIGAADLYFWLTPGGIDREALLCLLSVLDSSPVAVKHFDLSTGKV